jgi:endonuclease/exonuclease/phosphatase (EEP) superfamily protein YafD
VLCALALVGGGLCLAAALIAQGGRTDRQLDLLSHFAPLWLAGGVATALCGLLIGRRGWRRLLLLVGGLGVVAAAVLIAPEFMRPVRAPIAAAAPSGQIRLIQFNAWDENTDPQRAADWIAAQHPDIVTIEELTPRLRAALAGHGFFYTKGIDKTGIFSRQRPGRPPMVPPSYWKVLPEFARASFAAPAGAGPFTVVAVHLTWPNIPGVAVNARMFAALLDHYDRDRLIVAGDFNLTPWSFALRRLDSRLGLERRDRAIPTWPAMQWVRGHLVLLPALLPIDHIYAGRAWRTVRLARGPRVGSEHYPLVIDLALRP